MGRRGRRWVARTDAPRVIVVGAGFAGLAAVAELARAGMQVMLVDRNVYSTFQPLLYQVATAGLNPGDVVYSARAFTRRHGARFRLGELAGIDAVHRGSRWPMGESSSTTISCWRRGCRRRTTG
jgi:NADH dehydrogenase